MLFTTLWLQVGRPSGEISERSSPTIRDGLQMLTAIGAESCGVEQRQALPHKPC